MLLLENYFFFATEFCENVRYLARSAASEDFETEWPLFLIEKHSDVGDLMGAISGEHHSGFIGDTYLRYPFPHRNEDFKQNPEGYHTQSELTEMIAPYASRIALPITARRVQGTISIGDYSFARARFCELVAYVWQGGYPRWKDDVRPDYVATMRNEVDASNLRLFKDISWDG